MISKNFKYAEFSASATASARGINNEIPENVKPAVRALVLNLLQPLCDRTGWSDLITSGYRSSELNRAVGGASASQHCKGEAADNKFYRKVNGVTRYVIPIEVVRTLLTSELDFDQAIVYPSFVHLSYTVARPNRRQVLYDKTYRGDRL